MKSREVLEEGQAPHAGIGVVIQITDGGRAGRGDVHDLFDGDPRLFRVLGPSGRLSRPRPVDRKRDVAERGQQHRHVRAAVTMMAVTDYNPGIRPSEERRRQIPVDADGVAVVDLVRFPAIGPVRLADLGVVEHFEVSGPRDDLDAEGPLIADPRRDLVGPQVERGGLRERDRVGGPRDHEQPQQHREGSLPHHSPPAHPQHW